MEESQDEVTRGVRNPRIIDLIIPTPEGVTLRMIEDRPWNSEPEQVDQLGAKFNNYLDYVLDGWLVRQYPSYQGKKVTIELEYAAEPGEHERRLFTEMRQYAVSVGIGFQAKSAAERRSLQ